MMPVRASLVFAALALTASCSTVSTEGCTRMGCESGLTVNLEGAPPGPWFISVSSQGVSFAQDCPAGGNCEGKRFFPGFVPALVTVTVTRGSNTVQHFNQPTTQTIVQPNGPHCEPTCNQRSVTVAPPP